MDSIKTGKFIAELRKGQGLTQQQLADRLNLSNKTISKWESGAGSPDLSNLEALAQVLGVTTDELLQGELRPPVTQQKPGLTPAQKKERAIIAAGACLGAILGILAYNYGWLG